MKISKKLLIILVATTLNASIGFISAYTLSELNTQKATVQKSLNDILAAHEADLKKIGPLTQAIEKDPKTKITEYNKAIEKMRANRKKYWELKEKKRAINSEIKKTK